MLGLGRTGSSASNGSGDYVIAFSTAPQVRHAWNAERLNGEELGNDATPVSGNGQAVEALPLERVREVLARHGIGQAPGAAGSSDGGTQ